MCCFIEETVFFLKIEVTKLQFEAIYCVLDSAISIGFINLPVWVSDILWLRWVITGVEEN